MANIILFRGLRNRREMVNIDTHKTAGGNLPVVVSPPTSDQIAKFLGPKGQKYTAGECFPPSPDEDIVTDLTEYTLNPLIANRFSRRSGIVATLCINERLVYIIKGDEQERGVIVRSDAPYIDVKFSVTDKIIIPPGYNPQKFIDELVASGKA